MDLEPIATALSAWDAEILRFGASYGFDLHEVPASDYPRKRIVRVRHPLTHGIYINVEIKADGSRVEEFSPRMPCSVIASCSTHLKGEGKWALICETVAEHVPYDALTNSLRRFLEDAYARVRDVTLEDLVARGERRGP
jgi:hypothetical protein